jgi:Zn-dependent peptidase ImmA (M78 family)
MSKCLYQYALDKNIEIIKCAFPVKKLKGLYCDGVIYINNGIETERELRCVVAEELGHYETSQGNILNQNIINNQKQELKAREWAHQKLICVEDLLLAYKHGCKSRHEIADYLYVTDEFLEEGIKSLSRKHGVCKVVDNYVVYFDPLGVMEMF